jgi:hypothetical protein
MKAKKEKADDFTRGYLCSLSIAYKSGGGSVAIDEALRAGGCENVDPRSIDEYDREMLIKFQKEGCT